MKRNDFQSLLSDFRVATNTASSSVSSQKSEGKTLEDSIAQYWRVTRLRKETRSDDASSNNKPHAENRFHLAICICIIDSLIHEPIWKEFVSDTVDPSFPLRSSAELYIHAKYPERIQSPWVRERTIGKTFRPEWNDIRIVRAMLALASEALADDRTTHVIFLTESCIPIARLSDVARVVMMRPSDSDPLHNPTIHPNRSFVNAYNSDSPRCSRFDETNCFHILSKHFPLEAIYKALPGWCLLSRKHAQNIIDLPSLLGLKQESQDELNIWSLFQSVWAPEELYFPTCLSLMGHLQSENVVCQSLVFACWDEKAKKHRDRAHPRVYDRYFGHQLVKEIRASGYVFMRKLQLPIDLSDWKCAINYDEIESTLLRESTMQNPSKKKRQL